MITTTLKNPSIKSSFTIKSDLFKRLDNFKNKSKIVNEALSIYFEKNDYLEKAEQEYWNNKIQEWLNDIKKWNTTVINPKWEKIRF